MTNLRCHSHTDHIECAVCRWRVTHTHLRALGRRIKHVRSCNGTRLQHSGIVNGFFACFVFKVQNSNFVKWQNSLIATIRIAADQRILPYYEIWNPDMRYIHIFTDPYRLLAICCNWMNIPQRTRHDKDCAEFEFIAIFIHSHKLFD